MLPRVAADYRTMLWAFVLFPGVALAHYFEPRLIGWMLPLSLYLGFCAGVFSHNQNHCPTFRSKRANVFYAAWLSVFYGYPTFAWIPTHNLNHHKFINKAGDATITWRYSKKNNWTIAWTYFFVSSYWQSGPLKEFIRKAKTSNKSLYRQIVTQYTIVAGTHAALIALGIWMRGPLMGLAVWFFGFGVPALFALWSMMFINYIQHVHTDPWSKHNHSRNFVSKLGNWLVFNNGYHAVHHESAGLHWSLAPAAHAKIAAEIDPELCQQSIFWFCIKSYLLGIFFERFRTKQVGRAPYDPPDGAGLDLTTASVQAAEAGVNASMA